MSNNKQDLLVDLFKAYCKFFVIENQTALLEGRNYNVIYRFLASFSSIVVKESHDYSFCEKSVEETSNAVEEFIKSAHIDYYFIEASNCCHYDDRLSASSFYLSEEVENMFEYFYKTYSIYSTYSKVVLIEELLIEFNNFLSHFAKHITNSKRSTGISHLYRGCLDGHKEIIKENTHILLAKEYPELIKDFIRLRIYETKDVGNINKISDDKVDNVIDRYNNISNDIITILG